MSFLGRVPREAVLAELRRAHFSVLVRPSAGYAQAGFPSKVPESLAAGCPVLLNLTSDLRRYLVDGREGILLDGSAAEDVRRGIERALRLDDAAWRTMSRAARERAHRFDYRGWTPVVSDFVTGVGRGSGAGQLGEAGHLGGGQPTVDRVELPLVRAWMVSTGHRSRITRAGLPAVHRVRRHRTA